MPERILWSKYFDNEMFYFIYAQKYIKWQTMETSCHRQTCLFWLWMSGFIIHMLIFCERWNVNTLYIRPVFNLYQKYVNIYFTNVIFFKTERATRARYYMINNQYNSRNVNLMSLMFYNFLRQGPIQVFVWWHLCKHWIWTTFKWQNKMNFKKQIRSFLSSVAMLPRS